MGRNNQLTEAGSLIYGYCRQMFEISEDMEELMSKRLPSASRKIHIGVSDEIDRSFVVDVVSYFLNKHGLELRPKVSVVSGTHEQLVERLRFREIDVVVSPQAVIDPELTNLDNTIVPVMLICPKKHKIKSTIKDLLHGKNLQWLMPSSRYKLRSDTDNFFEENDLKANIVFESDVIASLVRSVQDEIGFVFLPTLYVAREIREKTLKTIGPKDGFWKYKVWLSCHHQYKNDPLISALSLSFRTISKNAEKLM